MTCECPHAWELTHNLAEQYEYTCRHCRRVLQRSDEDHWIYCREESRRMVVACSWPSCIAVRRSPMKHAGDRLRRILWFVDSFSDHA